MVSGAERECRSLHTACCVAPATSTALLLPAWLPGWRFLIPVQSTEIARFPSTLLTTFPLPLFVYWHRSRLLTQQHHITWTTSGRLVGWSSTVQWWRLLADSAMSYAHWRELNGQVSRLLLLRTSSRNYVCVTVIVCFFAACRSRETIFIFSLFPLVVVDGGGGGGHCRRCPAGWNFDHN